MNNTFEKPLDVTKFIPDGPPTVLEITNAQSVLFRAKQQRQMQGSRKVKPLAHIPKAEKERRAKMAPAMDPIMRAVAQVLSDRYGISFPQAKQLMTARDEQELYDGFIGPAIDNVARVLDLE